MTNFLTFLDINKVWSTDFDAIFVPEIFYSLVAMLIIFILSLCIFFNNKIYKRSTSKAKRISFNCLLVCRIH